MANLAELRNAALDLDREERVSTARSKLGRRIPRPFHRKASQSRTGSFPDRFRARLTLLAYWAARNAPTIRRKALRVKSDLLDLGGMALIAWGVYLLHPSAGFIVAGIELLIFNALGDDGHDETDPGTAPDGRQTAYGRQ